MKEHEHPYWREVKNEPTEGKTHVVDHSYAMTNGGGFTPGHFSSHSSENEAKKKASELLAKHKDNNFHARKVEPKDRPYKKSELPS